MLRRTFAQMVKGEVGLCIEVTRCQIGVRSDRGCSLHVRNMSDGCQMGQIRVCVEVWRTAFKDDMRRREMLHLQKELAMKAADATLPILLSDTPSHTPI